MELETLELFLDVMRARNFTRIARARGVAPSSISRAITHLEDELGVRLFQRSTRRLEPTEAAQVYFERIESVVAELRAAGEMATDLVTRPTGTLRITAATVYGQMYVVPLLAEIAACYPDLSVELILTDAFVDLIEERIDLAIRLGSLQDSSYIARKVAGMRFHVCATPDYLARHGTPTDPVELRTHNCLLFPRSGYDLDWLFRDRDGEVTTVPIQGRYLVTNSQAIRQCALAGMGIALLPDWLVREELAAGELVDLFPVHEVTATDFDSAVWLVYPSREYLALKVRAVMDLLLQRLGTASPRASGQ